MMMVLVDRLPKSRLCCEDRKEKDRVAIEEMRADEMMNGPS